MAGEKSLTFKWVLDNFSRCPQGRYDSIHSPVFKYIATDQSEWNLFLFPRSVPSISLYLQRVSDIDTSRGVCIGYELSFLDFKGLPLVSKRTEKQVFTSERKSFESWSKHELSVKRSVLHERRSEFLPDDALTACCRIWSANGSSFQAGQCFARTKMGIEKVSFLWSIYRFSELPSDGKSTRTVPFASKLNPVIILTLVMNEDPKSKYAMDIKVTAQGERSVQVVTCFVSLLKRDTSITVLEHTEIRLHKEKQIEMFTLPITIYKCQFKEEKDEFFSNDTLTLKCEFAALKGVVYEGIEDYISYPVIARSLNNENLLEDESSAVASNDLVEDLEQVLINGTFGDIELKTDKESLLAHKVFLCARSQTFREILMEKEATIPDLDTVIPSRNVKRKSSNSKVESGKLEGNVLHIASSHRVNADTQSPRIKRKCTKSPIKREYLECASISDNPSVQSSVLKEHLTEVDQHLDCIQPLININAQSSAIKKGSKSLKTNKHKINKLNPPDIEINVCSPALEEPRKRSQMGKAVDSLKIPDVDLDTLRRMLRFIYTDEFKELDFSSATKLYIAATKYQIVNLVRMCSNFLLKNVKLENFCEILVLSYTYKDSHLMSCLQRYAADNDTAIFSSDIWDVFRKDNSDIAAEIMQFTYKRRSYMSIFT